MKMLKVTDEATLLSTTLNFESTSTIEARTYISSSLWIMMNSKILLLVNVWRRSVMLMIAAVWTMLSVVGALFGIRMVITTPKFRPQSWFTKVIVSTIDFKVVVKSPKLRNSMVYRSSLEHGGLRRRGQVRPGRLANLIEIVCDVIEYKLLSTHHCLVRGAGVTTLRLLCWGSCILLLI